MVAGLWGGEKRDPAKSERPGVKILSLELGGQVPWVVLKRSGPRFQGTQARSHNNLLLLPHWESVGVDQDTSPWYLEPL